MKIKEFTSSKNSKGILFSRKLRGTKKLPNQKLQKFNL
jgi:hypothetical protein